MTALVALAGVPCRCARAQAPAGGTASEFPSTPPKPGAPRDFRVPEAKRFTLDNGLQVALVPWGSMPKVRVTVDVRTGNAFEQADEVWLADFTGDLLREGTKTRSGTEVSAEAARMGGALSVTVGADRTVIGGDVLSEFGPQMVDLVADVARTPGSPRRSFPGSRPTWPGSCQWR